MGISTASRFLDTSSTSSKKAAPQRKDPGMRYL